MSAEDIVRLQRMLDREKKARREAEAIAERSTRELYRTVEQLRTLVESISAPALVVKPGLLVFPIVRVLTGERMQVMTSRALHACREHRARAIVIDMTGVPSIEQRAQRLVLQLVQALGLLGARTIVTGLSGEVATALASDHLVQKLEIAGDVAAGIEQASQAFTRAT